MAEVSNPNYTEAQRNLEKLLDRASSTAIMFAGPEVPATGNWTKQTLIDEAACANEAMNRFKKLAETLKEVLKSKLDEGENTGRADLFEFTRSMQPRVALNQEKAKVKLVELGGDEALQACVDSTEVSTMRFRRL